MLVTHLKVDREFHPEKLRNRLRGQHLCRGKEMSRRRGAIDALSRCVALPLPS